MKKKESYMARFSFLDSITIFTFMCFGASLPILFLIGVFIFFDAITWQYGLALYCISNITFIFDLYNTEYVFDNEKEKLVLYRGLFSRRKINFYEIKSYRKVTLEEMREISRGKNEQVEDKFMNSFENILVLELKHDDRSVFISPKKFDEFTKKLEQVI